MEEFDFGITYRPNHLNIRADVLSQNTNSISLNNDPFNLKGIQLKDMDIKTAVNSINNNLKIPKRNPYEIVSRAIYTNLICRYGAPETIQTDMGREFECTLLDELCKTFNINKGTSTPYRHQETGKVERLHRGIREKLRIRCNEEGSNWDTKIEHVSTSIRMLPSQRTGLSPIEMVYGKKSIEFKIIEKSKSYHYENYKPILPKKSKDHKIFKRRNKRNSKEPTKFKDYILNISKLNE
ncbi:hypothetical protein A3Q56_01769 [Intoshia linei]|uniref:Integrase catalytic domain-containing protein n=1 Tax=Intoshia linei TaxID=1819745 RepID=A0A177B8K3_9BILA|nr:hypothetical protein A3Q56_01769 [Intoshia linei]